VSEHLGPLRIQRHAELRTIVFRLPVLTEDVYTYEIIAMEMLGVSVELYPLRWGRSPVTQKKLSAGSGVPIPPILLTYVFIRAQWHFIRRDPAGYFSSVGRSPARNLGKR